MWEQPLQVFTPDTVRLSKLCIFAAQSYRLKPLEGIDLLALQSFLHLSKDQKGNVVVLDPLRRRQVIATPEEIVRQLWIIHLTRILQLNQKLIAVERAFNLNGLTKRFDLVVFKNDTLPLLLAEFKAPGISITQAVFDQIAHYNMKWEVPYSLVSNGQQHYCFRLDHDSKGFVWEEGLPFSIG